MWEKPPLLQLPFFKLEKESSRKNCQQVDILSIVQVAPQRIAEAATVFSGEIYCDPQAKHSEQITMAKKGETYAAIRNR